MVSVASPGQPTPPLGNGLSHIRRRVVTEKESEYKSQTYSSSATSQTFKSVTTILNSLTVTKIISVCILHFRETNYSIIRNVPCHTGRGDTRCCI